MIKSYTVYKMRASLNEVGFLIFFLPLFAIKLLNITAESVLLRAMGVICFGCFVIFVLHKKYSKNLFLLLASLLVYTAILVFTCEKQGAFFSVVMIILMKGVNADRKIYRICLIVGLIFLFAVCILNRHGWETSRFINGEWRSIIKRGNIGYISYTAVVCLYLFIKRNSLKFRHIVCIFIISYLMYLYMGSRTGFISVLILLFIITILRHGHIKKWKLARWSCILSPVICFGISWFTAAKYGSSPILIYLDKLVQGRILWGNYYLNRYSVKLFGQPIYESYGSDFCVLDCAYLDMLICEGAIFLVLWILVNTTVIKYMYDNDRMTEVAILVMYAFYGICETFLPNCFLNMSWFLYGEYLYARINQTRNDIKTSKLSSISEIYTSHG